MKILGLRQSSTNNEGQVALKVVRNKYNSSFGRIFFLIKRFFKRLKYGAPSRVLLYKLDKVYRRHGDCSLTKVSCLDIVRFWSQGQATIEYAKSALDLVDTQLEDCPYRIIHYKNGYGEEMIALTSVSRFNDDHDVGVLAIETGNYKQIAYYYPTVSF